MNIRDSNLAQVISKSLSDCETPGRCIVHDKHMLLADIIFAPPFLPV